MTQDNILVSPTPSVRLKPGASKALRLSPSEPGDTAVLTALTPFPQENSALFPPVLSAPPAVTPFLLSNSLIAHRPSPILSLNTQPSTLNFLRKYLITSLFSATRRELHTQLSTLNAQLP